MDEQSLRLSEALSWTKKIVRARTSLTDEYFEEKKLFDYPFIMKPKDAITFGLISAVAEPTIPANSQPGVVV